VPRITSRSKLRSPSSITSSVHQIPLPSVLRQSPEFFERTSKRNLSEKAGETGTQFALKPKERTSGELSQHRKGSREASTLPKF